MTRKPTPTCLALAIAALLASAGVQAQQQMPPPDKSQEPTDLDSVVVRSEYIPEPLLESSSVMSVITKEDLDRQGDDNAAQALTRVSGLAAAEGKYVYVRGLNERYSSAQLGGSPLPSPEPLKRVVPLDLFPANVLSAVDVQKTYSARYPGEFGGGIINLEPLAIPDKNFASLGLGTGGNSQTTFKTGNTYYGSDWDFFGYDDGTRKVRGALAQAWDSGKRIDGGHFSDAELKAISRDFVNAPLNLLQQTDNVNPDFKAEGSIGRNIDMGDGMRAGFVAVAGLRNSWRSKQGVQQEGLVENGAISPRTDYEYLATENDAMVNALVGAGMEFGKHELGFTTMYVHDTSKVARIREGYDERAGRDVRDDTSHFYQRTMVNNQLKGKHGFGEYDDLKITWRLAHARAQRNAPYEKGIRYRLDNGWYRHDGSQEQNYTRFSKVDDRMRSAGADLEWYLPTERTLILRGGFALLDNDRDAVAREFRFLALNRPLTFNESVQRVDYLLSQYNIDNGLLTLRETTGAEGAAAYTGKLETRAVYGEVESQLLDNLRLTAGLRYEDAEQSVTPVDLFGDSPLTAAAPLENDYLLPALTATWTFSENMQLRLGASRTIARPQFRELAPQQYLDIDTDRLFIGNPYLVDSRLLNLDARFEWYFGKSEYFTAGVFHKKIDKPVESVVNEAGSTLQQTFINAPEATLTGLELDYRKYFAADMLGLQGGRWVLGVNYTWSTSEVNVGPDDMAYPLAGGGQPRPAAELVRDGSPMQGQSDHLANVQFGWENPDSGSQAILLASYGSERISARGRPGQPDFMFKPGTQLDLVVRKGMAWGSTRFSLGLEARNLLRTEYHEYQKLGGGQVDLNRYDPGTSISISLSANF